MKRWVAFSVSMAMVLSVCLVAPTRAAEPQTTPAGDDAITSFGIDLQLHKQGPTFGEVRQPSFRVRAVRGDSETTSGPYHLEEAEAVIARDNNEDMLLSAARCFFDGENEVAVLDGGVRATIGELTMDLRDLHWDNTTGVARSDQYSETTDGTNWLSSDSIQIFPREDRATLFHGVGKVQLAAEATATAPGGAGQPAEPSRQYKWLSLHNSDEIAIQLDGKMDDINGGVLVTLSTDDPADDMEIRAESVKFNYADEDSSSPESVLLRGKVTVEHPKFSGAADRVSVNIDSGDVELSGGATVTSEYFEEAKSSTIRYNLNTGTVVLAPKNTIARIPLFKREKDDAQAPAESRP